MIKLQGIHLSNVDEFEGRAGYGYTADIKLNNRKIGTVGNYADGSEGPQFDFAPNQREKFQKAVDTFTLHMQSSRSDAMFNYFYDLFGKEAGFIEYWFTLRMFEESARKLLKQGYTAVYLAGYFENTEDARNKNLWDEVGDFSFFGARIPFQTKEVALKVYKEKEELDHYNYILEVRDFEELSVKY